MKVKKWSALHTDYRDGETWTSGQYHETGPTLLVTDVNRCWWLLFVANILFCSTLVSTTSLDCHQNLTFLQRQCSLLSIRTWSTCSRRLLFLRRKGKHDFKCEFGWAVFNFPCKLLLNNDPHDISRIFHIFLYLNHGVNEYHTLSLICNNLPINRTSKNMKSAWIPILERKILQSKGKGRVRKTIFFRFWNEQKSNQSNCKGRKKGQRDYKMTFNDPHWPQNHINVN